jgi:hypothetical protein
MAAANDFFDQRELITDPAPERYTICYDHSCSSIVTDSLDTTEWRRATAPFSSAVTTATAERAAIAGSIAILETIVGNHIGTSNDKGGNLSGIGKPGQFDCIDESTNTTSYLRMLENHALLRFHTVMKASTRFGLFVGMPHSTAVIREIASGEQFAVDSWFFDNGQAPYIVKLTDWKDGKDPY